MIDNDRDSTRDEQADATDSLPSRRTLLQALGLGGAAAALPSAVASAQDGENGSVGSAGGGSTSADPVAGFFERGVDVSLEKVVGGLTAPTDFAVASDDQDRWFVTDQTGEAYYVENGEKHQFMSVDDRMVDLGNIYGQYPLEKPGIQYDERGLLGLEFHPNFLENRKLYVRYSAPPDEDLPDGWDHYSILAEFKATTDLNAVEPDSHCELLRISHPQMNHNAGPMAFGPDGYLYVPMGDGGGANDDFYGHVDDWYGLNSGGNAQDVSENLLGTIMRIDVDDPPGGEPYGIPNDNPLVDVEGALDEIYAWGFRNPFGISFDSNGNLFQADAGQALYEEVSVVLKGGNYGWNLKEATHTFDAANQDKPPSQGPDFAPKPGGEGVQPLIDPIVEFPHTYKGEIVGVVAIGGYVYEGDAIPELQGKYVYGAFHATHGSGRLLTAAPPGGELGEVTLDDLEPNFPEDAQIPSEYVNAVSPDTREGDAPSGETGEEFSDALIDTNNAKDEIPRDQLWDMAQLNVVGTEDGTPNYFVRMFGRNKDGELYVLVNQKEIPTGNTGAVLKIVPPDSGTGGGS